jgi:dTDP-4-dehydrorhamnose 3,5-epimerase
VNGEIKDVIVKKISKYEDKRGWLAECFRHDEMEKAIWPEMSYVSLTLPGIARGPHEHIKQTDSFCFLGTTQYTLYLWDNRKGSETFGVKMVQTLNENEIYLAVIPPGVVHAYKNTGKQPGHVLNFPNKLFAGWDKKETVDEIRHEADPSSHFIIGD